MQTKKTHMLLGIALLLSACSEPPPQPSADTLLTNGRIYTVNQSQPWAEAIAITNGQITAVGTTEALQALASDSTETIDLDGAFVMPGINDGHAHPAWGGLMAHYYCLFPASAPPEEIADTIESCVAASGPDEQWIQGGLWAATFFDEYEIDNPRGWLDAISGDKAIALKDDSGHNYWVNSRALELLGIDGDSVPPPGGVFGRDSAGELDGVLYETFAMVADALPPWSVDHYLTGVRFAVTNAHGHGVTGFKDASASETELQAYHKADQAGELKVHVAACMYDTSMEQDELPLEKFRLWREQYASEHLHTNFTKIFLDGIPTMSKTAAVIEPYQKVEEDETDNFGSLHVEQNELINWVTELDAAGFTIKIHAAADRSVHVALNAIEAARQASGESQRRHELAHAGLISTSDLPRFAQLNVVADLSPHLWYPSPIISSVREAMGPRGYEYWPNRSLLESGAPMLVGSDWPSVAPDLNPWIGMEAIITRQDPDHAFAGQGWDAEKLSITQAIRLFTIDGARALGLQERTGTLEVGKSADLIVLNHNLLEIPAEQINETQVQMTFFEGELVYTGKDA